MLKYLSGLLLILFTSGASAQDIWEVEMVRAINPNHPDNGLLKGISSSAEPISVAVPAGMLALSLLQKNKALQKQSFEILGSLAIGTATTQLLKRIVKRPRPYETYAEIYPDEFETGRSFPSGHTTTAFATAASLTLTAKKWYIAVPAFAWATTVGYSRIYLGQHYPSDIMMGALVGTASGFASHWLMKKLNAPYTNKKKVNPIP